MRTTRWHEQWPAGILIGHVRYVHQIMVARLCVKYDRGILHNGCRSSDRRSFGARPVHSQRIRVTRHQIKDPKKKVDNPYMLRLVQIVWPIIKKYQKWLLVVFLAMAISGCAATSSKSLTDAKIDSSDSLINRSHNLTEAKTGVAIPLEQQLRVKVHQWIGTPHRLGGTSRNGIDCSGFVQMIYRDILKRSLPRSTALQVKSGLFADRNQLMTGDLVFFRLSGGKRHVGIYLGQTEFAHASTSRGVMISSLNDHYWRDSYWMARRYMRTPQ